MQDVEVEVASWNRFLTTNLSVEPRLLGLSHTFNVEKSEVTITLPSVESLPEGSTEADKLSFSSWREVDGQKVPLQFDIHSVDVVVSASEHINIPQEALIKPLKRPELFSKQQLNP